ncbi:SCO1664 family protein [Humibacter antri]
MTQERAGGCRADEDRVPGLSGAVELVARIPAASNDTFLASIDDVPVVYKPREGETPLWDFPDGDLADREFAAYLVSEHLGWNLVPPTWIGDGPLGEGMLQLWQQVDTSQSAVDVVPSAGVPYGWCRVFEGADEDDRPIALAHEDSPALRRMAIFDALVNNADRKGGHLLAMPGGHRFGVDHGLTFHADPKLRTVLWGWVGEPLAAEETEGVARVRASLRHELGGELATLLSAAELEAFADRCDRMLAVGRFPAPSGWMPATPWPLF